MPLALLALAIGAFGIGTTEFVIMGVLPEVAAGFDVSIPTAGFLVSGYALGVVIGAPITTALGTRVSRKRMLMLLMGLFIVGNLLSALAPAYFVMLIGRVVASLAHGAFFGIGSVVAADLVAPDRKAGALAMMFSGLTVANVVGVPLGTLIGQSVGWRATFAGVAALGVVGLLGIARLVPEMPRPAEVRLRHELAAFKNVQVLLSMAMTVLGFGGVFAAVTYVGPMMTQVAGFADSSVTWLLVLLGLGMVGGNLVGGRYADRALMPMLYVSLGALVVVLALFFFAARDKIAVAVTLVLVGALGFATVPPLQKRVLDPAHDAPTLASAVNIGAFNLGNALAAWLGGLVIDPGLGYPAPNWVGSALVVSALVLAFVAAVQKRKERSVGTVVAGSGGAGPRRTPLHHRGAAGRQGASLSPPPRSAGRSAGPSRPAALRCRTSSRS
ncbi:MFS transporter [Streptomyces caniscabiei]|uniref:MFS transporter n=1 Tax=Streptomyces caniscabiei TaxID=2746961 RepID=A0A927L8X7_9ACTN|nr:MFS transporter [Streptomyces caniscabiei]MBD9724688.1 MFS transporter [Streptomyces caniscabiei]MDX3508102.1 MFS transporter [Streptomyces caniscabiei]MDX3718064.1 MFS transporter [Streptomyces caniscabiei]WEO25781.1 MFS transporter [Streptomyces caniscabiei]